MCSFGTPKHGGFAYLLGKMQLNYGGLGRAASAGRVPRERYSYPCSVHHPKRRNSEW
ncbi:hypothetical protein VCRA2119O147_1300006 [Vibrio crassostreae]|nr:hypothetical protein VCRA2112E186_140111 [Vibrio crassostreae]CAK1775813.1 hypothetical protein VCRA2112O185_140113 [Vibrio crassostreae]CAK1957245.1 hypothetical protein VCRA2112O187_270037 [Vibrio crassostreae]CAK2041141.1 hypothetical protein VCRA2112O188_310013 [Vibrio crassostreae]CAK2057857.1 hypothetical protein VCRA2112O184_340037 [Vibrio crassostreae]